METLKFKKTRPNYGFCQILRITIVMIEVAYVGGVPTVASDFRAARSLARNRSALLLGE